MSTRLFIPGGGLHSGRAVVCGGLDRYKQLMDMVDPVGSWGHIVILGFQGAFLSALGILGIWWKIFGKMVLDRVECVML